MSLPIAVFISGGGTTLRNLIAWQQRGQLDVDFRLVISSAANAKGLEFAAGESIPQQVIVKSKFADDQAYSEAMFQPCRDAGVKLVVMAGFLKHVLIPADFENRVVNIHPSLIPSFCGAGMYGTRVHQAVLDFGAKLSGCTVHFVDNDFDHGPIIAQHACEVRGDDTAASLAARVFERECDALPRVVQAIAEGRVSVTGRRVHTQPTESSS
ncbi:Phosphoribosylglycinamide formyltransferase [Rosistilla carotiformis]|uniref:Phosphoribosylglycinamide formyltransferase n=1 Tax=Rosistilla carotiformis TaxID=2528017 RepID=A0A518JRQ5_9BACT|nr:phosphoribosylglycinamide formyltransferase [Rosistilla carotiformis]QDV68233.1 Phosphoribosylglycinamide formyltransferase [Rosistilla carotiformis]